MNKYELALVVSAKIDDDARSKQVFVLWNLFSDIFVLDRTQSNS